MYAGCSNKVNPLPSPAPVPESQQPATVLNVYIDGITEAGANDSEVVAEIEKKLQTDKNLNVIFNFSYGSLDSSTEQIDSGIASGQLDAFVTGWSSDVLKYITQGDVVPIDTFLKQSGTHIMQQSLPNTLSFAEYQGNTMGLAIDSGLNNCDALWMRKELLNQAGLAVPQTMNELEEALRAFKAMDPSLIPLAQYGFILWPFAGYQIPLNCADSNGDLIPYISFNGVIPLYYSTPEFEEFMGILQRWAKDGLISAEQLSWTRDESEEQLKLGKFGAVVWPMVSNLKTLDYLAGNDPQNPLPSDQAPEDWVCVTNMQAPSGQYLAMNTGRAPNRYMGITKNCKDPDAVIQVIDWLATDKNNMLLAMYGREGIEYNMTDGQLGCVETEGKLLYSGIVSQFDRSLYMSDIWPLAMQSTSKESMKAVDPATKWCAIGDSDVFYTYLNSMEQYNNCLVIVQQYMAQMLSGTIDVQSGIREMSDKLDTDGIYKVFADMNAEYKAKMSQTPSYDQ